MPFWMKKRKLPPLATSERCLCSECGGVCTDPVSPGLLRCDACHYFIESGRHISNFDWRAYCRSVHAVECHGDPRGMCQSEEEHKVRVSEDGDLIVGMVRRLDHAMDVAVDRRDKGQASLWEAA